MHSWKLSHGLNQLETPKLSIYNCPTVVNCACDSIGSFSVFWPPLNWLWTKYGFVGLSHYTWHPNKNNPQRAALNNPACQPRALMYRLFTLVFCYTDGRTIHVVSFRFLMGLFIWCFSLWLQSGYLIRKEFKC